MATSTQSPDYSTELERARQDLALATSAFEAVQRIARPIEEIMRAEVLRLQEARGRVLLLEERIANSRGATGELATGKA